MTMQMDWMRKRLDRLNDEVMPRLARASHDDVLACIERLLTIHKLQRGGRLPGLEKCTAVEVPALEALAVWGKFHRFGQDGERGRDCFDDGGNDVGVGFAEAVVTHEAAGLCSRGRVGGAA